MRKQITRLDWKDFVAAIKIAAVYSSSRLKRDFNGFVYSQPFMDTQIFVALEASQD